MKGPCVGHVAPEALDGGAIALVQDGDLVEIDIPARRLAVVGVDNERRPADEIDAVLAERREVWRAPAPRHETGILSLYSRVAGSSRDGAPMS
jgi:dihydroxyacid dehydratase/phosphogluconate dehydratase